MRSPRTYPKGGKEESRVGIFWLLNGKLLIDSTPLDEAERYGDFLTHPRVTPKCGRTTREMAQFFRKLSTKNSPVGE